MLMPNRESLEKLIHLPGQWSVFFAEVEHHRQLVNLKEALEALPESSIRDARLARVVFRLGNREEAIRLLTKHKKCVLCKSWYFAILANEMDEPTLKMLAKSWRPDWPILSLTDQEAKHRGYIAVASAATMNHQFQLASEMYQHALIIAKALDDPHGMVAVQYNHALAQMHDNNLKDALFTFEQLASTHLSNSTIQIFSAEYAAIIKWFFGHGLDSHFSNLSVLKGTLVSLKSLTREFYLKLPLGLVEEHRANRQLLADSVLAKTEGKMWDALGFMRLMMRALAYSMLGNPQAVVVMDSALKLSAARIGLLSMVHMATTVQVFANMPHLPSAGQAKSALRTLIFQWERLPVEQRIFLRWWLSEYCPVPLHIVGEFVAELKPLARELVVVDGERATCNGVKVKTYPVTFMTEHILSILSEGGVPYQQRVQAHRHKNALLDREKPYVIFQPVIDVLQRAQN